MASLSFPAPKLHQCVPYCTTDPVLGPIIVFYSPQSSLSTSRVEAHILTCAGFQSYPRLALSPSSPLFAAVNHLPLDLQSSEIHRGLAIAVLKYFSELPKPVKETILRSKSNVSAPGEAQAVAFDEMHAGDLAARLKEVESESLASDLESAVAERFVSSVDLDIVLRSPEGVDIKPDEMPENIQGLLELFGEPTHLPFTKLKRAPSKPASAMSRPVSLSNPAEALDREIEELRYTEENYVAKLLDLLENVAKPLKQQARLKKGDSSSPSMRDLDGLFPPSLEQIIDVNSQFLDGIENGGLAEISKCCVKEFPKFKKPYEDYLRASANFPQLLNRFTKDKHSSFSRKVQQTGEQKLRSLIIEPVQRLPRYSLLIDNMINCLSPDDPSLGALNDARDVITDICSLQTSEGEERSTTTKRLQSIIISWPASLRPSGRLVAAVDFYDVLPPYNHNTSEAIPSILLLFPDCIAILRRPNKTSMLARGVMAEVDRPGGASNAGSGSKREGLGHDLQFAGWIDIADVRVSSSDYGSTLWMVMASNLRDSWDVRVGGMGVRKMQLVNAYEGRANKIEEDIAKARLERRIASGTRGIIGVREAKVEGLTFWCCVWGSESRYASKTKKGSTVVYLDSSDGLTKHRKDLSTMVGKDGVDIAVTMEGNKGSKVRVDYRSWSDYSACDLLSKEEALTGFARRIYSLLRVHALPQHPPLTAALLSANRKLLRSVNIYFEGEGKHGKMRPPSPGKIFSSFRGGGPDRPGTAPPGTPQRSRQLILDHSGPVLTPSGSPERPAFTLQRGATVLGLMEVVEDPTEDDIQKITMAGTNPLRELEDTFEGFVGTLKTVTSGEDADLFALRDLSRVDPIAVEGLLGQMTTDPKNVQLPMNTAVDVVFQAFSKFLRREWKEGMGDIMHEKTLTDLQSKSDTLLADDFEDYFKTLILDWTPQNKRAFRTIVLLLKELQSQMTEDDQKGILTQAFTGLLAGENLNALQYIGMMDRLVGDSETLFNEAPPKKVSLEAALGNRNLERTGAIKRAKSNSVTGSSVTSGSSLRKRFGISSTGSLREAKANDMSAESSKGPSVWRTLSKNSRESVKDSWKEHISRSRSTDTDIRPLPAMPLKRPSSGERPTVLGSKAFEALTPAKPLRPMSTIMQSPNLSAGALDKASTPSGTPPGLRRTKRRSSLSDLTEQPGFTPANPIDLVSTPPASPAASAPSLPVHPLPAPPTPDQEKTIQRLEISKKNSYERKARSSPAPDSARSSPVSAVGNGSPTPSARERAGSLRREKRDLPRKSLGPIAGQPQRLKMQTAPRLRERLESDHQAISNAEASLLREIDKIGEELSSVLKPQRSNYQTSRAIKNLSAQLGQAEPRSEPVSKVDVLRKESQAVLRKKEKELEEMDAQRRDMLAALQKKEKELEEAAILRRATQAALQKKERELEELSKRLYDCREENDVMFEKFNEELAKIAAAFKQGKEESLLVESLQDAKLDQGRLKNENMRLRKENASLRSRLDGPAPG